MSRHSHNAEVEAFYAKHPELDERRRSYGSIQGSISDGKYQELLENGMLRRAFGGTPQLVRDRNGGWVQAAWGDPRVTNADDADGGDEFAGYSPSAGEFAFNGDCMAEGHLPV